jgi:type II secretory pathway pseudopilin PulG
MKKTIRKNKGFTLIELILVLGLLTAMGAMAAPQFMAVLDNGKNDADVAQMDQLMVAFQLEQAPFFETHDHDFDLLKSDNIMTIDDGNGNLTTKVDPDRAVQTLQDFLNATFDPNHEAYMKDLKCLTSERMTGENGVIFRAALTGGNTLKIVCEADQNESSIVLQIPKTDMIAYEYSHGEPAEGTWMIIGDDDRLRADYVDAMMHIGSDQAKQRFIQTDKGKKFYQYRTTFTLNHQQDEVQPQVGSGEFWQLFTHQAVGGTQKIGLDLDAWAEGSGVKYRYRYVQGKKWKGKPYNYKELGDQVETLNVAQGHTKEKAIIEFSTSGLENDSRYSKYGMQVYLKNKLPTTPTPLLNDKNSGWIQTGKNHWFYYELLEGDSSTGGGGTSTGSSDDIDFSYHAGAIFNYVDEDNYDYLSIEKNRDNQMVMRSYSIQGGAASDFKTEKVLKGFEFNTKYTMDIRVEKGKALVNISDGILEEDTEFKLKSNNLKPAIGYYLNESVDLGRVQAIANASDTLPLVNYDSDSTKGPSFQLMTMPEFYPYQSTSKKPDEQKKPDPPSLRRIGIETLTIQPVVFQLSTDEEKDYVMTLRLPNGTTQTITSRNKEFSVNQSGTIEAFVEVNGTQSDTIQIVVDNIIDPFTEIEGTYTVGSKETSFTLHNFDEVMQEMEPFQKREKLKLIMMTKGKRTEIKKSTFTVKNNDLDLDDFTIFVESEYGQVLSPIAEVSQPVPPVVTLSQARNYGYARTKLTTETGDDIYYRLLDEDHEVLIDWKRYSGVFEERFNYIEAVTRTRSGTESESVIVENPYANAVVHAPTIEPDGNGYVHVSSAEGTILYYWNGSYRDDYYWNGSSRNSNEWLSVGHNTKTFYLAEGETLVVYAKSAFGSQESVDARYTQEVDPNEVPVPPIIEKTYYRNRIEISGTNYDEIWYRYTYMKNKNKQRTTEWEQSYDDVVLDRKDIISVEAYTVSNEIKSETSTWSFYD